MGYLLADILLYPKRVGDLAPVDFNQLIPQARSCNLLTALATQIQSAGVIDVPPEVERHLRSSLALHEKQKRDLAYDSTLLQESLAPTGAKVILLKGAAYLLSDLEVGRGRLTGDIDILAPQHRIEEVEQALNACGWESSELDPYNERYYRQWMHEIPPMVNRKRGSTLDLHHTILPPTAAAQLNADLLFDELRETAPGVYTLSLRDMVIHSATHLFHEGEFHNGLRDLWDLDRMLREFPSREEGFWEALSDRAGELDLRAPLFQALRYAREIFHTPVPASIMEASSSWSRQLRTPLMDFLFRRAFRPPQPECTLPFTPLALQALYIRSHYLRMPLYLLLPHLARKAWMGFTGATHQH